MKLLRHDDTEDYFKNIQAAALKGAAVGAVVSLGLRAYIKHRSPTFFKTAGGYQLGLLYAAPAAFCSMTNMERMSVKYEQKKNDAILDSVKKSEAPGPQTSAVTQWFMDYKYHLIVSGWAASMAGSFWFVNRDRFMTKAQKIVQARVYAQGLTVLMLLASVAFSVTGKDAAEATKIKKAEQSRSWERDLKFVAAANKNSKPE